MNPAGTAAGAPYPGPMPVPPAPVNDPVADGASPAPGAWRSRVAARPVAVVWFATTMFSTGPVMIAASSVSGPVFSFWRMWIGVPILSALAVGAHRRTHQGAFTREGARWTAMAGVAFAIHQVSLMTALRATSVVDVTLMNTLAPLVVALLAVRMFGERPGPAFRAWSVVAMAGAAAIAVTGSAGPGGQPVGIAFAAANVVFYSFFFVCSKRARDHVTTMSFLAGATTVAALVVALFVLVDSVVKGVGLAGLTISGHDLLLALAVAALPGLVGHFSMTWSLKWVPANVPPVIMLSAPVMSGVLAWFVLGQAVTAVKVVGGLVTLVGVAGAIRSSSSSNRVTLEALDLAEET